MPNVMGREFPYTPEGMAQAEQYKQAMGMRGGGMMGFRPLGYADGDLVTAMAQRPRTKDFDSAYKSVVQELYRTMSDGTDQQVRDFINSNRDMLNQATTIDDPFFDMLRNVLPRYQPPEILGEASPSSNIIPAGIRVAPRGPTLDPEVQALIDQAEEEVRLEDPAYAMADEERMAGMGPEAIHDETQKWFEDIMENRRSLAPLESEGDFEQEPLAPMPPPPWMMDPRFKGYYNPNQLNPFFNPKEIEVADGGYITRKMNRGGIMSLRGY